MTFYASLSVKKTPREVRVHRDLVFWTNKTFVEVASEVDFHQGMFPLRRHWSAPLFSDVAKGDCVDFVAGNIKSATDDKERIFHDETATIASTASGADSSDCHEDPPQGKTLMMRNIPNKYLQSALLKELSDAKFWPNKDFDFIYLPVDRSKRANLGYCFINFLTASGAADFTASFDGKRMKHFNSRKRVAVMPAQLQGYGVNKAHFASCRVSRLPEEFRPLFFGTGDLKQGGNGTDDVSPNASQRRK